MGEYGDQISEWNGRFPTHVHCRPFRGGKGYGCQGTYIFTEEQSRTQPFWADRLSRTRWRGSPSSSSTSVEPIRRRTQPYSTPRVRPNALFLVGTSVQRQGGALLPSCTGTHICRRLDGCLGKHGRSSTS